jgi:hypothetical protein
VCDARKELKLSQKSLAKTRNHTKTTHSLCQRPDKSKVLTLNLRNRLIFRSADEADAVQAADFIGKKRIIKRSWGYSMGKRNVNYSETEEHKIKPYNLRNLRDHECVLVHCERGFRRVTLSPLESDGTVATWFSRWRRWI